MLQALSDYCPTGMMPGIVTVQYVPTLWVNREIFRNIRTSANIHTQTVQLLQGNWLSLRLLPNNRLFTETSRLENGLPSYVQKVTGVTPSMRPGSTGVMAETTHYQFLIRLKDRKGNWWLLGTPDNPFTFSYEADTNTEGYRISFDAVTERSAAGYNI